MDRFKGTFDEKNVEKSNYSINIKFECMKKISNVRTAHNICLKLETYKSILIFLLQTHVNNPSLFHQL